MSTGVIVWSQTAATNATADSNINWAEGMAPSQVNDSARAMMTSVAKWRDDLNATLTLSGGPTSYTLSTNQVEGSLTAGYSIAFTPNVNCGNTVTINVDSLGAKPLRSAPATELLKNALIAGVPYRATYYTSNSGEWIINGKGTLLINVQTFFTNGTFTYTPTAGMQYCFVECVGSGGGGGGAAASASGISGGGGGGGGSYCASWLTANQVGASQSVVVSAGGSAGSSSGGNGGNGNATDFGSLVEAGGGFGGAGASANSGASGGLGGSAAAGTIQLGGGTGGAGVGGASTTFSLPAGFGGAAPRVGVPTPGAFVQGTGAQAGAAGNTNGGGGSGGVSLASGSGAAGGAGQTGMCIVTEYLVY